MQTDDAYSALDPTVHPDATDSERLPRYFAAVGLRVTFGASDDPECDSGVWQVGLPDELHVLEFGSRMAVWRWWQDRVTDDGPVPFDPCWTLVVKGTGWLARALQANSCALAPCSLAAPEKLVDTERPSQDDINDPSLRSSRPTENGLRPCTVATA